MIKFLCGCSSLIELPMPGMDYFSTFDSVVLDEEGFIQCAIHRQRRYGWRAPNHSPRYGGLNDLQFERLIVWGEHPVVEQFQIPVSNRMPDLRPHIYEGMLDEQARAVLARVARGANGKRSAKREISAEYCDLATDSSHSSANGLNG